MKYAVVIITLLSFDINLWHRKIRGKTIVSAPEQLHAGIIYRIANAK